MYIYADACRLSIQAEHPLHQILNAKRIWDARLFQISKYMHTHNEISL